MSWLKQSVAFAVIGILCALGTYLVHGEYDRRVPCLQSEMDEYEVCLGTVLDDWRGEVVWVDARAIEEKEVKLTSVKALEITEANAEEEVSADQVVFTLFTAKGTGTRVVVFCQADGCDSSKIVRDKIIKSRAHDKVYYLHGGWKAIEGDGRLLGK